MSGEARTKVEGEKNPPGAQLKLLTYGILEAGRLHKRRDNFKGNKWKSVTSGLNKGPRWDPEKKEILDIRKGGGTKTCTSRERTCLKKTKYLKNNKLIIMT